MKQEAHEAMTSVTPPVTVVTVQAGTRYPDFYVDRLRAMVKRHLHVSHRFICWTDDLRPGRFHPSVEMRDLSSWGLSGFFNKLRLFDPAVGGETPFLFLDLTMVVRDSLDPLLEEARRTDASLIAVADWNYPVVNSSVMWVRPDVHTQQVWEAWTRGERFHGHIPGDQNFIDAVFKTHHPDALAFWPSPLVASYKGLRKMARHHPEQAQEALTRSVILKFHGHPKPHEVLNPWAHLPSTIFRQPLRPRLWRYLADEIQAHWHDTDLPGRNRL
jgi:hypothetical protein